MHFDPRGVELHADGDHEVGVLEAVLSEVMQLGVCTGKCYFFQYRLVTSIRYNSSSKKGPKLSKFEVPPTSTIFENKRVNPNLFRLTTSVSAIQLVLWCYLSYFALTELDTIVKDNDGRKMEKKISKNKEGNDGERKLEAKKASKNEEGKEGEDRSTSFKWFMSSKWRLSLSLLSLGVGAVFAATAYIYPLRMVRTLTYVRPTQMLEVVTYTPWGSTRQIQVPLVSVVCNTPEAQVAKGQSIALKIKDYSLFFLLNPGSQGVDPMLRTLVLSRQKH